MIKVKLWNKCVGKYASAGPLCDSHPGAAGPAAAAGLGICICRPHSQIHADLLADSVLETRLHDVLYQEKAIPRVTEWDVKGQETGGCQCGMGPYTPMPGGPAGRESLSLRLSL